MSGTHHHHRLLRDAARTRARGQKEVTDIARVLASSAAAPGSRLQFCSDAANSRVKDIHNQGAISFYYLLHSQKEVSKE